MMKKALLSMTGIALIALVLAALAGVALASGEELTPFGILEKPISNDLDKIVRERNADVGEEASIVVNNVQGEATEGAVEQDVPEDDGPEGEHPEGEHVEGGCGGYADPSRLAAKIEAAAEFLGLTPEEIAAQVQAGKRLYEVAAEQGADVEAFREAVHAVVEELGGCGCGSH